MFIKVCVSKSQHIKDCNTGLSWLLDYCLVIAWLYFNSPMTTHSLLNLHTRTGQFRITNVSPTEDKKASKVEVKVQLDIFRVFFVRECAAKFMLANLRK